MKFEIENLKLKLRRPSAFTLVEMLVVIGILAALIGILLPTLSKVRQSGYQARSQQTISALTAAIEQYQMDYRAYPGPIPNGNLGVVGLTNPALIPNGGGASTSVTGSENLLLGLMGGLKWNNGTNRVEYDASFIGKGPQTLGGFAKPHPAYIDNVPVSSGAFVDLGRSANDSGIPEFVDSYPDPLPILYIRANAGAAGVVMYYGNAQYDLSQIIAYTATPIGKGNHGLQDTVNPVSANTLNYFQSPGFPGQPVQKDTYILISAGSDRIYGTADDITNFVGGK